MAGKAETKAKEMDHLFAVSASLREILFHLRWLNQMPSVQLTPNPSLTKRGEIAPTLTLKGLNMHYPGCQPWDKKKKTRP